MALKKDFNQNNKTYINAFICIDSVQVNTQGQSRIEVSIYTNESKNAIVDTMVLNPTLDTKSGKPFIEQAYNYMLTLPMFEGAIQVDDTPFIEITLEQVKQFKIASLKQSRDTEELSPITYGNYRWDFDQKAQMRINGAIMVLGDDTITWTSADNQEIKKVTADDLRGVIGEAALRSNSLHIKYRELKTQVEECKTIDEVNEIIW